jgi:hypothetical protein
MEIIEKYPDKHWNWFSVLKNSFKKDKQQYIMQIKAQQQFIREHVWEELVKVYMHPNRIIKYLELGYQIEKLDDIL